MTGKPWKTPRPEDSPARLGKLAEDLVASLRRVPSEDPAGARLRPVQTAGDLIEDLRVKYAIGREAPEHVLRERWAEVVGAANAAYSHPIRLEATGRLVIHISHAVIRNELFMHREEILIRIGRLPSCGGVKSLFLTSG